MKTQSNPMKKNLKAVLAVSAFVALTPLAQSAVVTWNPVSDITGDTDVSTLGTLERAYNFGSSYPSPPYTVTTTTVNTVVFSAFGITWDPGTTVPSVTVGSTTLSGLAGVSGYSGFGAPGTFTSLTPAYQALLGQGASKVVGSVGTGTVTLTLAGLTVGQQYLFQTFANDSLYYGSLGWTRATFVSDGVTSPVELIQNTTDTTGGVGQYVIGTFTADATSQIFTFDRSATVSDQIDVSGFQLRTVPEPSTWVLLVLGGTLLKVAFRRRSAARL